MTKRLRITSAVLLCLFLGTRALPAAKPAAAGPLVRVLIAENQAVVSVSVKGPYTALLLPSLKVVKKREGVRGMRISASPKGIRIGEEEWPAAGIRILPREDNRIFVHQSRFRGFVDILKKEEAGATHASPLLYAVNHVGVESYLYGVLHHEVSPWWPMEALKSQAIAARTYALYQAEVSDQAGYDLRSSTVSQVYGGSATERYRTRKAVDLTAGKVLTYQGKIFPAYFHATCAGRTAAAEELWKIKLPPLAGGVRCGYCKLSPHYFWRARVPLSEIEEKLDKNARSVGQVLSLEIVSQTPSHRVGSLRIKGTGGETVVAAKDFRVWVGGDRMRSTRFTAALRDDFAEFKGEGWGHGVGLCQWGTLGQALLGRSHKDILRFYYPRSAVGDYKT